jgi:uncharacterized protein (TIGR02145 family)
MNIRNKISFLLLIILLLTIDSSCKKDKPVLPTIVNSYVINVSYTNAASGATITDDGGSTILARGVCWNNTGDPTIDDNKTYDGYGTGSYKSKVEQLIPGTLYYLRAYATNSAGTSYDNPQSFTTSSLTEPGTVTDIEGNTYNTIVIGNQTWMTENLKTTKYRNDTEIPLVTGITEWFLLATPGYCWYNNDGSYKNTYGALYNWYTIEMGKNADKSICPFGWHLPSDTEWSTLTTYLLGSNADTVAIKSFRGQFGGARTNSGAFYGAEEFGEWWSSSAVAAGGAWSWYLDTDDMATSKLGRFNEFGLSVRCVKDN